MSRMWSNLCLMNCSLVWTWRLNQPCRIIPTVDISYARELNFMIRWQTTSKTYVRKNINDKDQTNNDPTSNRNRRAVLSRKR